MTGRLRASFAALLLAAITYALGLAAAPQLHDWLHHSDQSAHQCAATLLSSGSVEHFAVEPAAKAPERVPVLQTFSSAELPRIILRLSSSLLEHAPPALS